MEEYSLEMATPSGQSFKLGGIVGPVIGFRTQATATVVEEEGFFILEFTDFIATQLTDPDDPVTTHNFDIGLHPDLPSTGTVSKLNDSNVLWTNHNLNFHLMVRFGDQSVTFKGVSLSGLTSNIGLDKEVAPQAIQNSEGKPATLRITSMEKEVGQIIDKTKPCTEDEGTLGCIMRF